MLIRCDKCSTLYELDDKLLPPQGAPVQCSRCQFVFRAYPAPPPQPAAPERAANETAPEPEPDLPEPPPPPRRDQLVREGGALASTFDDRPAPPSTGGSRLGADAAREGGATPPPGTAGAVVDPDGPKFTADGRPIRKVPFPGGDPPQSGPRTPPLRAPVPKRSTARSIPTKWVMLAVAVVIVLAAVILWRALAGDARGGAPAGQVHAVPQAGTPEAPARK